MKKLLDGGHFYEGARWHEGHWWVSDLYAHTVLKITPGGTSEIVARVEHQPSGLGWLPDGTLLVVSMKDRQVLRVGGDGSTSLHADIHALTGSLANDMVTDGRGNAYVGNLGFDLFRGEAPRPAALVHIAPGGMARIAAEDLLFPNGMVVTPDNRTLIVAESFGGRLTAFTIAEDGSLYDRRIWAQVGITPKWDTLDSLDQTDIVPDGCSLDREGCIWLADAKNGRVVRVAENRGIIDQIAAPPGMSVYSCAVGGDDGLELLVCTAPGYDDVKCTANRDAVLYVARLGE